MTAKELKASILQLAVTGKLVLQDPNDEPASVLLKRIKAEKAKLVKAGKIKKDKNPSEIVTGSDGAVYEKFKDGTVKDISEELPFEIPNGWAWVSLESLGFYHGGHTPSMSEPSFWGGNILWVSAKDMKCDVIIDTQDKITHKGAAALQMVNAESLVLVTRSGILKHTFPVAIVKTPCTINQDLKAFIPYCTEATQYLALCLRGLQAVILKRYRKKGMTVQSIIWESFIRMPIPLPPLAEQKRIVAKIEKLMPLVEEYGKMEETRLQLDADLPAMLEKSILQDAIQGKLVPQDPNDEPASELLKRIATERKALVKAGKLKRDKSETVIFRGSDRLAYETRNGETVCIQDEIPFEIPDSWEWVRLGSVCSIVRGSGIKRSETTDSGSPCIRYGEIYTTYGYSFQTARSFTSESVAAKCHKAHAGDVLCTLTGECKEEIAKATAYLGTEAIAIGGDLARISNHPYNPMLLIYFMFSPFMLSQKADKSNGDIIVHIGKEAIENLLIPLPPRSEQERIVAKVTKLLSAIKSFTT